MTQYLITTFTDSTGQMFTVVEAGSKEEALQTCRREALVNGFGLVSKGFKDFKNKFKKWQKEQK